MPLAPSLTNQAVKLAAISFLASLLVGTLFMFSPNFASASNVACKSHGVVADAADGQSVILTVELTGTCSPEPLVLSSITNDGVATELLTAKQIPTKTGTSATLTFIPETGATYEATIYEAFAATLSK